MRPTRNTSPSIPHGHLSCRSRAKVTMTENAVFLSLPSGSNRSAVRGLSEAALPSGT